VPLNRFPRLVLTFTGKDRRLLNLAREKKNTRQFQTLAYFAPLSVKKINLASLFAAVSSTIVQGTLSEGEGTMC